MVDEKQVMISVIIPVYNGEQLLNRCIQSVRQQTYDNFELLLINDGSTDNSLSICQSYAKKDKNIFVYSQKNQGVSAARNKGIELAKGKLICFIDADDWVDKTYLESLHSTYENENADLVISNSKAVLNKGTIKGAAFQDKYLQKRDDNFIPDELFKNGSILLRLSIWAKLYKKNIIDNHDIRFKKELKLGEDFIFVLEYALKCRKIVFTNDYTYNYDRTNENSVIRKYNKQLYVNFKNTNDVYFSILEKYRIVNKNEKLHKYFELASQAILEEGKANAEKTFTERWKSVKDILNISEIAEFRKRCKLKESSNERILPLIRKLMMLNQALILTVIVVLYHEVIIKALNRK